MPDWTAFGAVTGVILLLVLGLARATSAAVGDDGAARGHDGRDASQAPSEGDDERWAPPDTAGTARDERTTATGTAGTADDEPVESDTDGRSSDDTREAPSQHGRRPAANGGPRSERPGATDDGGVAGDGRRDDRSPDRRRRSARGRASTRAVRAEDPDDESGRRLEEPAPGLEAERESAAGERPDLGTFSTTALLVNVVFTHGIFAAVIVGAATLTEVPWPDLGIAAVPLSTGLPAVGLGIALGCGLYVANAALAANLEAFGIEHSEALRTSLSPDSVTGWAVLFVVVLPLVAGFEELLFRAALIGGFAAGFGLDPWLLVVLSSIAFALGHGIQGPGGILVTGLLGAVLGAAFVLTNSLLLVVVAHYVINGLEFLVHEGLGIDLKPRLRAVS